MKTRTKVLIAAWLGGIGLIVLVVALVSGNSIRGYLADNYHKVSSDGDSIIYTSDRKPKAVYEAIRAAVPPADVQLDPQGYFLRYSDDIVAVTADGDGSRIYIDDERRGYSHWFPFVVGVWGTGSGSGEGIRGGGPGGGK